MIAEERRGLRERAVASVHSSARTPSQPRALAVQGGEMNGTDGSPGRRLVRWGRGVHRRRRPRSGPPRPARTAAPDPPERWCEVTTFDVEVGRTVTDRELTDREL